MKKISILVPLILMVSSTCASGAEKPLLVVLEETGQKREGVPVFGIHPNNAQVVAKLLRGWPLHMLRLFRCEQTYLRANGGPEPEPAYLLLSNNQGGFPRYGFFLG